MPPADADPTTGELLAAVEQIRRAMESGQLATDDAARLASLTNAYGADADAETSTARRLGVTALALLVASLTLAVIGIVQATRADTFDFGQFGAYGLVALAALGAAALVFRRSTSHERAAREARRLQRQLQGVDPYLAALPPAMRHLLRGALTSSLFPSLVDEEPWRQPQWPDPRTMLDALGAGDRQPDETRSAGDAGSER